MLKRISHIQPEASALDLNTGVWQFGVPLVALLMLVLMLIPARIWRQESANAIYRGFDANLVYASTRGNGALPGVVDVTQESLTLAAVPNSEPTATLLTAPFSFSAEMDLRILHSAGGMGSFRIAIWSPEYEATKASGYFLDFNPAPNYLIGTQTVLGGRGASSLSEGAVIRKVTLGRYSLMQRYRIKMTVDRESKVILTSVSSSEQSPTDTPILRVNGGYGREIGSGPVSVKPGKEYAFGGFFRLISGADKYKLVVWWFDENGKWLTHSNDWRDVRELAGWSRVEFRGLAPERARTARLFIGSGLNTEVLVTGIFLRRAGTDVNLLSNPNFGRDAAGWESVGDAPRPQAQLVGPFRPVAMDSALTAREARPLLDRAFLSLTISAPSQSGLLTGMLDNYQVTVPQHWQVAKVRDPRATALLIALQIAGSILTLMKGGLWLSKRLQFGLVRTLPAIETRSDMVLVRANRQVLIGGTIGIIAFLIGNVLLFGLGSYWFDMFGQRIWAYVAAKFGLQELYILPSLVTNPGPFGRPETSTIYAYHPLMAYLNAFTGWVSARIITAPGASALPPEWLIKLGNTLFALASAFIIYKIMRQMQSNVKEALLVVGLFLFNPLTWFGASVWGQTYVVSFFFLLASIWQAERGRPHGAWLALMVLSLTRAQMLVPVFLLGLVYLRKFEPRTNLLAISWAMIVGFLAMAPFLRSFAPSLPVDLLAFLLRFQEGGGNEPTWTIVSGGAYSVWALVTRLVNGATGRARMFYPSATLLFGNLTYQQIGFLLAIGVIVAAGLVLLLRRKRELERGGYLPLVAAAFIAFLMLKTGLGPGHLSFGLPLLLVCTGSLTRRAYYFLVTSWTVTTFVSMYGELGSHISLVPEGAPLLHHSTNPITRAFMTVSVLDWSMTLDVLLNLAVPIVLIWQWIRRTRTLRHNDA